MLDRYVAALGGASAIERITSRVEEGVVTSDGNSAPIEVFSGESGKQTVVRHLANGDSSTVFDGHNAWFITPGRSARRLQDDELEAVRFDADLHFPIHIRQIFPELRVEYPETVRGVEVYLLVGVREGQAPVRLYLDKRTGFLVRLVRYAESPLGLYTSQIDYDDYREVNGVELPFRTIISVPTSTSTIEIKRIRQNVPIAVSRFGSAPTHP